MLEAVCAKGGITCSGRNGGRTARILEHMGYVTVEYYVVWVRRQRWYSVDTVPVAAGICGPRARVSNLC
jgi:hypothetical protein